MSKKKTFCAREIQFIRGTTLAFFLFLTQWLHSRKLSRLLYALPAVFVGVAFCGTIVLSRSEQRRVTLLEAYLSGAREAVQQKDAAFARLSFRRAQVLSRLDRDVTYEFALCMYNLGLHQESLQMMAGIAPLRSTGHLPAHRFLAEHAPAEDPVKADVFKAVHLSHIVRSSSDCKQSRMELISIFARYRRFDQADKLLRQTLDQNPEDRLTIARLKAKSGKIDEAREEALLACSVLQSLLASSPHDDEIRIQLAQGYIFLGDFSRALIVLVEGFREHRSPRLISAMAATYEHWYSLLDERQQERQRICLLRILSGSAVADGQQGGRDTDRSSALFTDAIESDHRSLVIPLLLGSASAAAGDLTTAENSLRSALKAAPEDPSVKNNLAWVLGEQIRYHQLQSARQKNIDVEPQPLLPDQLINLSEALSLSDAAVLLMPDEFEFRETRAQLLALSGRHVEAISDFELCLDAGIRTRELHQALSKSLRAVNRSDEAIVHSELAKRMPASRAP